MKSTHDAYRNEFALSEAGRAIIAEKERDALRNDLSRADKAKRAWRWLALCAAVVALALAVAHVL